MKKPNIKAAKKCQVCGNRFESGQLKIYRMTNIGVRMIMCETCNHKVGHHHDDASE